MCEICSNLTIKTPKGCLWNNLKLFKYQRERKQLICFKTIYNYYAQILPLEWNLQKARRFILSDVVHIQVPIKGAGILSNLWTIKILMV